MKATRYASSRQKACQNCSAAKAKCNRQPGGCGRCNLRGLPCTYPQVLLPSPGGQPLAGPETQSPAAETTWSVGGNSSADDSSTVFTEGTPIQDLRLSAAGHPPGGSEALDFSDPELFSPINVNDISNRWLNSFVVAPGQKTKDYPATITAFVYRILNSYAAVTVRGRQVPPFVHASQIATASIKPPLSTCLSLVRICEKPLPGSEEVSADVLQREMGNLYEHHGTYDDMTLFAAFQAYLIYTMVLFFRLGQISNSTLRQAMTNLQDLACLSSQRGTMCIAEQQRARPRWEAWIVAEAKRRTLFAMYLFDSVLSARDGLQTFLGTELQGLPAPSSKSLWGAGTRQEWETAYNIHLADWVGESLRIDELWPIPADLDEPGVLERRNRVDQWLENVDEFGTMIYAVTICTHGG